MEKTTGKIPTEQGPRCSFFELVRRLESLGPEASRLGRTGPARDENIRLGPDIALSYPAADVSSLEQVQGPDGRERFQVRVNFLGLYGPTSPLPSFFTENLYDEDDEDAARVRAFLDIIHHRLLSLLYRSWAKYRYQVAFQPDGRDEFSAKLLPLTGAGTAPDSGPPFLDLLRCLGHLTRLPRSASGLKGLLEDFLEGIPVKVEQCLERWAVLKPDQKSSLGLANSSLGVDCLAGEKVRDRGGKFRVTLGPLGYEDFLRLTPPGEKFKQVCALTALFLFDPLDFDLEIVLRGEETPPAIINDRSRLRLGRDAWLSAGPGPDKSVTFPTGKG
ncbi:MAG: type VI secretion system baseplate subunit TssG [Pseudomonadota bacterium]